MKTRNIQRPELNHILARLHQVRVAVLGDFCLDIYWHADMRKSQLSRETPHYPLPVYQEQVSPGAGGNVVMNLHALGVKHLLPISVLGQDWRAQIMIRLMEEAGLNTQYLFREAGRFTPSYCKPIRQGFDQNTQEDPRIDFINTSPPTPQTEELLLTALEQLLPQVDVLAVCDQLDEGIITPRIREYLAKKGEEGKQIVVDSRADLSRYSQVMIKSNELETSHALKAGLPLQPIGIQHLMELAQGLHQQTRKPLVITLGERGALYYDGRDFSLIPSKPVPPPTDIVGAGDAFMSAFCAALSLNTPGDLAASFANLASGVTIRKLHTTGTASPAEILHWYEEASHE